MTKDTTEYATKRELAEQVSELIERIREIEEDIALHKSLDTVSRQEAAKILKISTDTLDRYIKSNRLAAMKPSAGRTIIRVTELVRFMKLLEQESYNENKEALE